MPHHLPMLLSAGLLLVANTGAPIVAEDVAMFQRVQLSENVSVTGFGIVEDSRCASRNFCFEDDELVVAAVVSDRGRDREVSLTLGEPIATDSGTITLTGTSTPASDNGAIQLKKYRLELTFQPNG